MMFGNGYNGIGRCFRFGHGYGYPNGFGMMIMMGIVLLLIVVAAILLLRRTNRTQSGKEALEILKLRYVKGEISEEEFRRSINLLNNKDLLN